MKPIKTAKQRTAEIARARGERVWVKDLQDQRSEPLLGRIFTDEHPCDTRNPFEGMRKRHSLGSYNLASRGHNHAARPPRGPVPTIRTRPAPAPSSISTSNCLPDRRDDDSAAALFGRRGAERQAARHRASVGAKREGVKIPKSFFGHC
jgi:hypothetical protein